MTVTREAIRERLHAAGLHRVGDQLAAAVEPAVRLRTEPTDEVVLPLGGSRIGGRPDAAEDFRWPAWKGVPLSFLGQIDLAEVSGFSFCDVLPESGRLLFFYNAGQQTWGFDPEDRGSFAVLYSSAPRKELVRHDWPDGLPDESRFNACGVDFREVLTLPPWESILVERLELSGDEVDRYLEVLEEVEGEEGEGMLHQLLGHPSPIQNEMQLECQLAANGVYVGDPTGYKDPRRATLEPGAPSWRLLFQLDSDDAAEMMWGDLGRLYFWIRDEDLRDCRFDQSWMILQCS